MLRSSYAALFHHGTSQLNKGTRKDIKMGIEDAACRKDQNETKNMRLNHVLSEGGEKGRKRFKKVSEPAVRTEQYCSALPRQGRENLLSVSACFLGWNRSIKTNNI